MRLNWKNYLFLHHDGYGKFGRGFVQALLRLGHDVYPFTGDELDMPAWYQQARGLNFDRSTIQLCPPHNMHHLPGRSIGYSMHESMTLPMGWADHVNKKCEYLIVPSPWLVPLFEKAGVKVPIAVIPGGINPDECPILGANYNRPTTFLLLADRGDRKTWDKCRSAFYKAFAHDNRNVRLIIKCRPGSFPNLDFSYSSDDRQTVWMADVEHMADVYARADAYFCPARCEGYGMSQREAAACGITSVVQRFSGTADDCDEWAVPLNKFTLVESGMPGCGGLWAEPNMDEIIHLMRDIAANREAYKARALKAAQWMREHQTYQLAAEKLVNQISLWFGTPPLKTQPVQIIRSNGHQVEAIPA